MDSIKLASLARLAGLSLYSDKSYDTKRNAQLNLDGRTHYVDDGTLSYFGGKILKATDLDNGLIFGIVESVKAVFNDQTRVYRPVFFDLYGNVIDRLDIEHSFKSSASANKAFWPIANSLDAVAITREAIANEATKAKRQHDVLRDLFNASFEG